METSSTAVALAVDTTRRTHSTLCSCPWCVMVERTCIPSTVPSRGKFSFRKARAFRKENFPREGTVLGMHVRSTMTHQGHEQSVECVRRVVSTANATAVLLVSMHHRDLDRLSAQLSPVVKVLRTPPAPPAQGADASHFESAVLDLLYLASTDGLLLSRGSTFGYLAAGLARRPTTIFSRTSFVGMSGTGKVGTCEVVPSTEPVFHVMGTAVRTTPSCLAASRAPASTLLRLSSLSY
mmetsp:Transcript_15975/g.50884  ORF Transcript_15975/g.50884 Transcript_15975/m.50884 type:complete len:237 (+) Transcript_15975:430-1140(+)